MIGLGRRTHTSAPQLAPARAPEKPWLSKEAASELIDSDGGPGPLFTGIYVGGDRPSVEDRLRIAEWARKNNVEINFEIADDELAAIRVSVTYPGGFGYEGADVLALRLHHPHTGGCTQPDTWIDDWAFSRDDVHVRARVRINRVDVRWEKTADTEELLARADELLGKNVDKVRLVMRDRWNEVGPHEHAIEEPYAGDQFWLDRGNVALVVHDHAGKIDEVTLRLYGYDADPATAMEARWGKPHVEGDDRLTWKRRDRAITAEGERVVITSLE